MSEGGEEAAMVVDANFDFFLGTFNLLAGPVDEDDPAPKFGGGEPWDEYSRFMIVTVQQSERLDQE